MQLAAAGWLRTLNRVDQVTVLRPKQPLAHVQSRQLRMRALALDFTEI